MKVRHKGKAWDGKGYDYGVLDESPRNYFCLGPDNKLYMLSKEVYEPIPEETWRDVTAECEFDCDLYHKTTVRPLWDCDGCIDSRYRLRKVKVDRHLAEGEVKHRGDRLVDVYAFIIEKKEPA